MNEVKVIVQLTRKLEESSAELQEQHVGELVFVEQQQRFTRLTHSPHSKLAPQPLEPEQIGGGNLLAYPAMVTADLIGVNLQRQYKM